MAEYIDRKALGIGKCNLDVFENKGYAEGWNSAIEIIENAPAADVVKVIRCKNCKNSSHHEFFWTCKRGQIEILVSPDGFCNEGKPRKEQ